MNDDAHFDVSFTLESNVAVVVVRGEIHPHDAEVLREMLLGLWTLAPDGIVLDIRRVTGLSTPTFSVLHELRRAMDSDDGPARIAVVLSRTHFARQLAGIVELDLAMPATVEEAIALLRLPVARESA